MTQHDIEKQIKRINERIAAVQRQFGEESKIYKDYASRIENLFKDKNQYFYGKTGRIAISHGKTVVNDPKIEEKLKSMDRLPTKGTLLKRAKKSVLEDYAERISQNKKLEEKEKKKLIKTYKPTKTDIMNRAKWLQEFDDFFEDHKAEFYAVTSERVDNAVETMRTVKRRKTYTELQEVVNTYFEEIATDKAQLKDWIAELENK